MQMLLQEELLKKIKCCFHTDGHIAIDPVLVLPCQSSACKQCIVNSKEANLNCLNCNQKHDKTSLLNAPLNQYAEIILQCHLNDLFEYIDDKLENSLKILKGNSDDLNEKIVEIETQIDLRYESFIEMIEQHRAECKSKLLKIKEDFGKNIQRDNLEGLKLDEKREKSLSVFTEIQNKYKINQQEIDSFRDRLKQIQFLTSKFNLEKTQFGEVGLKNEKSDKYFFNDSLILDNVDEQLTLTQLTNAKKSELIFRGTRDGFTPPAMHSKCDNKANLVSIFKTNTNYVFGAFTSVPWNNGVLYTKDENAFIHSIKRNGELKMDKFMIKPGAADAFYGSAAGSGNAIFYYTDIIIYNKSNTTVRSICNIGGNYQSPQGITFNSAEGKNFLAGNYNQWLTTEIEVYQIN